MDDSPAAAKTDMKARRSCVDIAADYRLPDLWEHCRCATRVITFEVRSRRRDWHVTNGLDGRRAHDDVVFASRAQEKASGTWRPLGETTASFLADHDNIIPRPPYNNFHRIKFKVMDAPLTLVRVVALYDEDEPDRVDMRERVERNGESRAIELQSAGTRKLRKVEFWYDVAGARGSARVTLFGMK